MGEKTEIAWCHSTFNPWIGCQRVAVGCEHCYAEAFAKRTGKAKWGPEGTRVKTSESYWKQPLKWDRIAQCNCGAAGEGGRQCNYCNAGCPRPRIFCASMADVFEEIGSDFVFDHRGERMYRAFEGAERSVDAADHYRVGLDHIRRDLFSLIDSTPNLDWLLLTKRPENVLRMWPLTPGIPASCVDGNGEYKWDRVTELMLRPNVWLGTSIATQADADRNIPLLLECRDLAPVLFLSCEPLVEAVTLDLKDIDWVIVGGESGHGARPCHPAWVRSIRDQCKASGVAFFFKQWGEWKPICEMTEAENEALYVSRKQAGPHQDQVALDECYGRRCLVDTHSLQFDGKPGHRSDCIPGRQVPSHQVFRLGKKVAGRLLDGVEHGEFPKVKSAQ